MSRSMLYRISRFIHFTIGFQHRAPFGGNKDGESAQSTQKSQSASFEFRLQHVELTQ